MLRNVVEDQFRASDADLSVESPGGDPRAVGCTWQENIDTRFSSPRIAESVCVQEREWRMEWRGVDGFRLGAWQMRT